MFFVALLFLAYIAPLTVYADAEQASRTGGPSGASNYPEVPGVPDNAVQHNKTNVTPVAQMEQVAAGEPALFQYRYMTMLMNCSRNCDVVFTVNPDVTPKIFGLSVEPNQTMALTINLSRSPLQGEMVMERALNFYLGIEPNATLQLRAQIKLYINQTELSQELNRVINASRLTWMYWNRTRAAWETVESHMDQNGYLVCNTDHFSTWTVADVEAATEYGSKADATNVTEAEKAGIDVVYIYAGAVAIIILTISLYSYARHKR